MSESAVPSSARVVIIGGGIMGCSLAYHLAELGWREVLLLEKGELTSGSTWHAAGQITYATSNYTLAKCVRYNMDLYARLEAETGQSPTFHRCGSLRVAYNEEEMDWLRQCVSVVRGVELPVELVSPSRIAELHPFYKMDGIIGGLHTPIDGHLDPAGATFALAKGARQKGATIIRQCRATGVKQLASGEWELAWENKDGASGAVRCEHVVNAGGMYARQMGLWNGYDVPTTSMTHHYVVTDKVPEFAELETELPVVRDDSQVSGYLRMEQKSGLVGIYEKQDSNTVWDDEAPWDGENILFEEHLERIEPWLEKAFERIPVLAKVGIKRIVHGAISHPPDGNPLIGPAPNLKNYWVCGGCQIGIGWGPALARELARWMANGAADYSMREFDPRRFGAYADKQYQIAKGREDYQTRHDIPYPHYNRHFAARPVNAGGLYTRLQKQNAVFEEIYGFERAKWFAPDDVEAKDIYSHRRSELHGIVAAECAAVQNHVGIMDLSAFGKVMVEGKDAEAFLNGMIPNRLPSQGRVALAYFLSRNGRMELEATITRLAADKFYIVTAVFLSQRLLDCLHHAMSDEDKSKDIVISDCTNDWLALTIDGPKSPALLAAVCDVPTGIDDFPWLSARTIQINGKELWAMRLSYVGECGWEFHGKADAIIAAYDALVAAGGELSLSHYGSFAMNSMRMEKAFVGASELTNEVNLKEGGVFSFVARVQKDSYIGREATVADAPLQWQCCYLQVEDKPQANGERADGNGGEAVFADGKRIGVVSSIAYGHRTNQLLAFAYLHPDYAAAGKQVEVLILNEPRQATVTTHPLYDPTNTLPKCQP